MRGSFIKVFRKQNNIKQCDLANSLGIGNSMLSKYENDIVAVSDAVWERFLDFYKVQLGEDGEKLYCEDVVRSSYDKIENQPNLFVKKFRERLSLTQKELALQLGISCSYISAIEVGASELTEKVLGKILEVYGDVLTDEDMQELFSRIKSENDVTTKSFENIGAYLVVFRKRNNIKQIELAKSLGVSSQFLSKIEYGKVKFPYKLFYQFLNTYSDIIPEDDKSMLVHNISKQNSRVLQSVVQNFVLANDLNYIFYDLANIKLEKEQIQHLFLKLLEEAKTMKKEL